MGEYERIRAILGRRPTDAELAIYSVMWSEHCSYKSSKVHLRRLAAKMPRSDALLAGMGQNAGVVDVGHGYAVTFKIESHNHPSYVEPHQGAATGVGGIVRDILAMGARPVAVMDSLRFGPADAPDTRRVLPGVVSGISFYGNCLGLPNIGGELAFDACYAGNPLVNALCVGVMRHAGPEIRGRIGAGQQGDPLRCADGPGRHRRRLGARQRHVRRRHPRQRRETAQRSGRRPIHGEVAGRMQPRALQRRNHHGHPGSRCRRGVVRDRRAGGRGDRRHAGGTGRGAAAGSVAGAGRDLDERITGTHDGGHRARLYRGVHDVSAPSGTYPRP